MVGKLGAWLPSVACMLACGGSAGGGAVDAAPADAVAVDAMVPADAAAVGDDHRFVFDRVLIPTTSTEANSYGLDLDGDAQVDNVLGQILSTLSAQTGGMNLQQSMDQQVDQGDVIYLADLQATSLINAANAGVWVFAGADPVPSPCAGPSDPVCRLHLDGTGSFTVASPDPGQSMVPGSVVDAHFSGGPGRLTVDVPLIVTSDLVAVELVGARIEVDVTADSLLAGRLAGGVTEEERDTVVIPAMREAITTTINQDCTGTTTGMPPCGCDSGSTGQTLLDLFDEAPDRPGTEPDGDCVVTLEELATNALITSLLAPDVDLLDADGNFAPGQDEINDCLSFGFGFSAVPASFPLPAGVGGGD